RVVVIGCLFGIVHNGSRTIEKQRLSLEQRVAQLSRLLAENTDLRQRVDYANQRMADANERMLRQIGADLHDGPVQLLGLALLKLGDFCEVIEEINKDILSKTDGPTSCAWPCAKRCAKFASCRRAWRLPTSRNLPSAKPYSWWRKSTSSSPARVLNATSIVCS